MLWALLSSDIYHGMVTTELSLVFPNNSRNLQYRSRVCYLNCGKLMILVLDF